MKYGVQVTTFNQERGTRLTSLIKAASFRQASEIEQRLLVTGLRAVVVALVPGLKPVNVDNLRRITAELLAAMEEVENPKPEGDEQ